MYQVAEFLKNHKIHPLPVVWKFKEKGRLQCYWPKRDLTNKLKKKTPPPLVRQSQLWDVLEIKILLNGKMFNSLDLAESYCEKISSALQESVNCSTNSKNSSTTNCSRSSEGSASGENLSLRSSSGKSISSEEPSTSTGKLSHKKSGLSILANDTKANNVELGEIVEIKSEDKFRDHELFLTDAINLEQLANYWLKNEEIDEVKFTQGMVFRTFDKEFFYKNVSFKGEKDKLSLADSNILRCWIYVIGKKFGERIILEKIIASMTNIQNNEASANKPEAQLLERSAAKEIIEMKLNFPIRDPACYKMVEVLLLQQSNIEIASNNWTLICQNKPNLFVQQMILKTFDKDFFLKKTTFKVGEKDRVLLEGSNIFKCWEVTVTKKFPDTVVDVKKYFQTYKNTLGKSANSNK